jgi:hypothetical protein
MFTMSRSRAAVAVCVIGASVLASVGGATPEANVLLCHGTVSEPNPYVLISIDASGLNGHLDGTAPGHGPRNHPDLPPTAAGDCNFGDEE